MAGKSNTDAKTAADEKDDKAAADGKAAETKTDKKPADDKAAADDDDKAADEKAAEARFTQAEVDRRIAKAVKDAEKKARDAEEKAQLSEVERLKAEKEELAAGLRTRDAKDAITEELAKLKAKSPGLLFNAVKDQLEFDDKGKLTNTADLIKDLQADFPEQFGTEKPAGGIDGGAGRDGKTPLTMADIKKMTPQEINANWDAVQAAMAGKTA